MGAIEKRIEELEAYRPEPTALADLEEFWRSTIAQARSRSFEERLEPEALPFAGVEAYDLSFCGFDDTPIHAWYLLPAARGRGELPCVVHFPGYRADRGLPEDYLQWLLLGTAILAVDARGQAGTSGNLLGFDHGTAPGWASQGILDKDRYYYRAAFTDCVRAVDWVAARPEIDESRICACGASQGGGLALAVAALSGRIALTIADIPNLCHMDLGLLLSEGSLLEIAEFLNSHPERQAEVMRTLSYFDILNLAPYIESPVLASACLKDLICLPETVFAMYNRIRSERSMRIYPFEGHSLPASHYRERLLAVKRRFAL